MSTLTHNFRNDNCTIMTYIKDKIYISDTPCEAFLKSGQYTNNYQISYGSYICHLCFSILAVTSIPSAVYSSLIKAPI